MALAALSSPGDSGVVTWAHESRRKWVGYYANLGPDRTLNAVVGCAHRAPEHVFSTGWCLPVSHDIAQCHRYHKIYTTWPLRPRCWRPALPHYLCTDLSELYGKKRANFLVTVGLFINGFILLVMTAGQYVASVDPSNMPLKQVYSWQRRRPTSGRQPKGQCRTFSVMYAMTGGAVTASMVACHAQYCDVQLFHWKRVYW